MKNFLPALLMLALFLTSCTLISFDEYDYDTHENAHIGIKGLDADVKKVRGGLLFGKKIKISNPKKPAKHAVEKQ